MARHFSCTACGKCCHGQLPLSIDDALAHADKFPLIVTWTPVRQGGRSFDVTAARGITIKLNNRKTAAVQITPSAYLPPSFACPCLTADGLCAIHGEKPLRCRAMPYSAYRDEADQEDLMIPRPGWDCDTSDAAPVLYDDRRILDRTAFDAERAALDRDARILRRYGEWMMDAVPSLRAEVARIAMKPAGGQVLVTLSSLVPRLPKVDIFDLADRQLPVMREFAERTAGDPALADFHKRYADMAAEWKKIAQAR
ncbi:MAG: YkgJ family cysteine cluster protein, partial [Rhodospirillales bacterium]|nr:YkgJ family cysteine cluster protein [Rhodospirillales bacterium]